MQPNYLLGIDGCKYGWFAFIKHNAILTYHLFDRLTCIEALISKPGLAFIDMPIGFPNANEGYRLCDKLARQYLPGRASSIFPVPCKAALYAPNYLAACQINQQVTGKRFPIQSWYILPKIRELDDVLAKQDKFCTQKVQFIESHPELIFAGLAGYPMQFSKASVEGRLERLTLLKELAAQDVIILEQALSEVPKKHAKADDIIDAFVLMYAATQQQHWQFLPSEPDKDSNGNPRQIAFITKPKRIKN